LNELLSLNIYEIFFSIQGESTYAGLPCIFIRLSGCNLKCKYCDTAYGVNEKTERLSLETIIFRIKSYNCRLVEITGGEPLLQSEVIGLIKMLQKENFKVLVETNGTQDIEVLPEGTTCIMDVKCPDSGEVAQTDWSNMPKLQPGDEIKFVISSRDDYDWACNVLQKHKLSTNIPKLFSPNTAGLLPADLAQWILDDGLDVRLQLQLHKHIWPDDHEGR